MADSSSGDVNQATPDGPPQSTRQPSQAVGTTPGTTVNPNFTRDGDPASYPFLFSPGGTTQAPGAGDIESLARRRFAPASGTQPPTSWPQDTAVGAHDSTSAAIASLLFQGQGSDAPASPQQPPASPDASLAAIQAAVTGLDSGEALGFAQRPAQMAAQAEAPDSEAEAATSSAAAASGRDPRSRSQQRSSKAAGRRGRGHDDDGSDGDAATERRRRRRCAARHTAQHTTVYTAAHSRRTEPSDNCCGRGGADSQEHARCGLLVADETPGSTTQLPLEMYSTVNLDPPATS